MLYGNASFVSHTQMLIIGASLFHYMREYAIKYRDISCFVCIDDKHSIKLGEPGFPIAAAERGRQVIVSSHTTFAVEDHDFAKFKLTLSVILLVNIPEAIDMSFYPKKYSLALKKQCINPLHQYDMLLSYIIAL
uniref:Uncharacterized protein n=1 Tax=Amphimedon queenslandica TaxID=400682 RepID=A0A1X7VWB7_AMPQE